MTVGSVLDGSGFAHEGFCYDSHRALADRLVPFVEEALDLDQPVMVVGSPVTLDVLDHHFGAHDSTFWLVAASSEWWTGKPCTTLVALVNAMRRLDRAGRPWRLVEEPTWVGTDRHRVWCRLEAALTDVLAGTLGYGLCLYDSSALDAQIVTDAGHTHPIAWDGSGAVTSTSYLTPHEFVRQVERPISVPPADAATTVVHDVRAARRAVDALAPGSMAMSTREDLTLIVSELAANALHACDRVTVSVWDEDHGVVCQVSDEGPGFDDPLAGYAPPDPAAPCGRGLWIARTMSDDLTVQSTPQGTTVQVILDAA